VEQPQALSDAGRGEAASSSRIIGPPQRGLRFLDVEESRPPIDADTVRPRRRFAVCIGIDGYSPDCGYGPLQFAGRDAIAVADSLLTHCGFDRVLLMTDAKLPQETMGRFSGPRVQIVSDLRRETIRNQVEKSFGQATGLDDVIVFYFAGHGDARQTAYLVPIDYHRQKSPSTTITLNEIFDSFLKEPIHARNKLIILDACRSSPADREGRLMARAFRDVLAQPDQRIGVITACDAQESSVESPELGHGRFTWALIQALHGDAYPPGEENLAVTDVFKFIKDKFETERWGGDEEQSPGRQNPRLFLTGTFFALAHRIVPKPQPLDNFEWEDLKRDQRSALDLYLRDELEKASSKYRYCLRVIESAPQADQTVRRVHSRLLAERARILYRLNRREEAETQLKMAEAMAGDSPALLESRGYRALDEGRYDEAARHLEQAISGQAIDGDVSGHLFFCFGLALYHLERFDQAATYFLKATEASERFALKLDATQYGCWAAKSFRAVGRLDVAEKLLRHVLRHYAEEQHEHKLRREVAAIRFDLAEVLRDAGRFEQARDEARNALEIQRRVIGPRHPEIGRSLQLLADISERMADYAMSETLYREASQAFGEALDRPDRDFARLLSDHARLYLSQGNYGPAVEMLQRALDIIGRTAGRENTQYAATLANLGAVSYLIGEYNRGETLIREALAIQRRVLGEKHPDTATSLHNLALLLEAQGKFTESRPMFQQALAIREQALGRDHPDTATSLNNLAGLLEAQGDYAAAKPLYERALAIKERVLGKDHPATATSLSNLAVLLEAQGDYAAAKPLYERALAIRERVLGRDHPATAESLNRLAMLLEAQKDYTAAKSLLQQALAIRLKMLGPNHPDTASSLEHLGMLLKAQGDYAAAKPSYEQALNIRRKLLGDRHPDTAAILDHMASLFQAQGDYAAAKPLYEQALAIRREALGQHHPDTAQSLANLAGLYQAQGDNTASRMLLGQVLDIDRLNLDQTAAVQSSRQQLAMAEKWRDHLDSFLSVSANDGPSAHSAYRNLLSWKGAVWARQRAILDLRLTRQNQDPEVSRLFMELQATARELSNLALIELRAATTEPDKKSKRSRIAELTSRKEHLEGELAGRSAAFRARQAGKRVEPEQLQAILPRGVALIDLLEYFHSSPPLGGKGERTGEPRMVAFVVRPDRPGVVIVPIGPTQTLAEWIDRWRVSYGAGKTPPAGGIDPGVELRRRLWEPLAKHLEGVQVVLVSSDGPLHGLPWAALPGSQPGTYLVHERAFAVVPVPQLLPEMLRDKPRLANQQPTLLLAGGIDFGQDNSREKEAPAGKLPPVPRYRPLLGTESEINDLRGQFEDRFPEAPAPRRLAKDKATKQAILAAMPSHQFIHLATHSFSAPSFLRVAERHGQQGNLDSLVELAAPHPGLLSGLVFAGANRSDRRPDETILTALEVEELDLSRVEMVVLSASETGLGKTARGEGVLGLQRAFLLAGARTVVASLWGVRDEATHQLMREFYRRLWSDKPMPRVEALRQAQLWMLESWKGRAGLERPAFEGPLPPYVWAAFVLSGDWR